MVKLLSCFAVAGDQVQCCTNQHRKGTLEDCNNRTDVWWRCYCWWKASVDGEVSTTQNHSVICSLPGTTNQTRGWPTLRHTTSASWQFEKMNIYIYFIYTLISIFIYWSRFILYTLYICSFLMCMLLISTFCILFLYTFVHILFPHSF